MGVTSETSWFNECCLEVHVSRVIRFIFFFTESYQEESLKLKLPPKIKFGFQLGIAQDICS